MLGNALAAFGVLWLVFAGTCTLTSGFSGRPPDLYLAEAAILQDVMLSLAFGAAFAAVGLWLRRISL